MGKKKSDMQNKDEGNEIIENNRSNLENNSNNSDLDSNNVLNDADKEKAFDIFYKSLEKKSEKEIFEKIQEDFDITSAQVKDLIKKENWNKKVDMQVEKYLEDINKDPTKKQIFDAFYGFRIEYYRDEAIQKMIEKGGFDSKIFTNWYDNENWEKLTKQKREKLRKQKSIHILHINTMNEFIELKKDTSKEEFSLDDSFNQIAEKFNIDSAEVRRWYDEENWEEEFSKRICIKAMREFIVFKLDTPKKKFSLEESVNQIAKKFNITSAEVHRWYVDENWNDEFSKWEDMKKTLKKFKSDELDRILSDNKIKCNGKLNKPKKIICIIKHGDYEKINQSIEKINEERKKNDPSFLKTEIEKLTSQIETLESKNKDLDLENEKLKDKGEEFDSLKNTLADIIFYIWSIGEYVPKDSVEFKDYKMQINEIKELVEHEMAGGSDCELKNQIEFLDHILKSFKNMHYKYKRFNNSLTKNKIIIQDDFLNKKYEPNMDLKVVSHSEDLDFADGAISKVIKPSIFYNNKKIHKGAIIVNRNSTEENGNIGKNITAIDAVEFINKSKNK